MDIENGGAAGGGEASFACAGTGECKVRCDIIADCPAGIERITANEVVCREVSCGDDRCDGDELETCSADCGQCDPGEQKCAGDRVARCNAARTWETEECPTGRTCRGDDCVEAGDIQCSRGEARCVEGGSQTCLPTGQWEEPVACPVGQSCVGQGACEVTGDEVECDPGPQTCNGALLARCDERGRFQEMECPPDSHCEGDAPDARCAPNDGCPPGASRCNGNEGVQTCQGGDWQVAVPCPGGRICQQDGPDVASCVAVEGECVPV